MKLFDIQIFLYSIVLSTPGFQALHRHSRRDDYASCTMKVWDTNEMKADDLPSIFAIIQHGKERHPKYRLPQFKIGDRALLMEFKHGEKLILMCHKDTINYDYKVIQCSNGAKVPNMEIVEKCEKSEAKPSVVNKGESCGGHKSNNLFEIGYEVFPKYSLEQYENRDSKSMTRKFFPFIQVCLDVKRKITSYTSHKIDGRVIAARQILSFIPEEFSMDGYHVFGKIFNSEADKFVSLKKTYNPQKQFHYLYKLFEDKLRDYFDNEDNNFVPRQLTPDYDMLLKNWKTLTHYYINTAPQWKIISCTWDALEELIRERASGRGTELQIYTGTFGSLRLSDIKVYLSGENLSVPKYFWKVVIHKREDDYAAIGFVTSNNPYDDEKESFCTSICRTKGWPIDVKTAGLGKTICCAVDEMLKKMKMKIPIEKIHEKDEIKYVSDIENVLVLSA